MKKRILIPLLSGISVALFAVSITVPVITTSTYYAVLRDFFGQAGEATGSDGNTDSNLDAQYYKSDYSSSDKLDTYEKELVRSIADDGFVLLKNDTSNNKGLPLTNSHKISLFSHSSVDIVAGGTGSGVDGSSLTLKQAFEDAGYSINETLWNFYESGNGSSYVRGEGSLVFGSAGEDWRVNECPLSVLRNESGLLDSAKGTAAIYVLSRTGGEGRDLARGMQNHTSIEGDKNKHYLEIDSVEEEIISYLDSNFDNVVLLMNSNNMMELGFIEKYENIRSVMWVPGGGDQAANSIVDVLSGKVTPSGHFVDTLAYDAFSSPAMANMGDFEYTVNGQKTNYYGVSYSEGIYVGYKYYETRYMDKVSGSSNVGDYDYASTVQFPFGYGLSYTSFKWDNFTMTQPDANGDITLSVDVQNVGDVSGRDVVQFYLTSPYTDYDKENYVEKAGVSLLEFAKTDTLEPDEKETVSVQVNISNFISYDDVKAKTYILDDGDYKLTAAKNAHEAANNILAYDGKSISDGMTSDGDSSFVDLWHNTAFDQTTYSKSSVGEEITNHFDYANYIDRSKFLTRSNWVSSWPETLGNQDAKSASSYSERNGYSYQVEISQSLLDQLDARGTGEAANSPISDDDVKSQAGSFRAETSLELINYRGLAYEDADWDALVSQMTTTEAGTIINLSGYTTEKADSINKPKAIDLDGPMGLNTMVSHESYSISYPAEVTIAATWDRTWAYKHGDAVAEDGLRENVKASGWYAPGANIHRTPFAGRNFEYYSEDSVLSGIMAKETVIGAANKGMYAFIKHFALNDQEDHRSEEGLSTWSNEQAIREIYLRPFQEAIEFSGTVATPYYQKNSQGEYELVEGQTPACKAVMTSYNRIGAIWAGGNYNLITDVLREEWSFNGFALTDYSQGETSYMATEQMLRAGGDAQLTQYGTRFRITPTNTYYVKQAMKHILYTVVNSNAMNGFIEGTKAAKTPFAYYYLIIIAIDVLCVGGIALCTFFIIRKIKKDKKAK